MFAHDRKYYVGNYSSHQLATAVTIFNFVSWHSISANEKFSALFFTVLSQQLLIFEEIKAPAFAVNEWNAFKLLNVWLQHKIQFSFIMESLFHSSKIVT